MQDNHQPQDFDDLEELLDDLEELLEDDSRTVTAQVVDDLDDLDTLLGESVALADARKSKNQGRKLSAEQQELLDSNDLAREIFAWEAQSAVAHFIITTCSCGAKHHRFSGWYHYFQHRRNADCRKLVAADCRNDLPAETYTSQEASSYCHECLANIPLRQTALDLALSLGKPCDCGCEGQQELTLTATSMPSGTMLDELLKAEIEAGEISMETFQACDDETDDELEGLEDVE